MPFIAAFIGVRIPTDISVTVWTGLWYMAIFPTAIGYTLYYIGVQKKGPAWAATYIYLVPSFTANLDYLFFKVQFTPPIIVGTSMVVFGLLLGNMRQSQLNTIVKRIKSGIDLFKLNCL
jgi:drug/metabolite transporter (DMT)-like permease